MGIAASKTGVWAKGKSVVKRKEGQEWALLPSRIVSASNQRGYIVGLCHLKIEFSLTVSFEGKYSA